MSGRRAIVGLCMLCALVFSAVAAQGASAITGTTAFTCASAAGGAGFSKEHCKAADAVSTGAKFQHVAIAENTTTELSGTNQKTGPETNETSIARLKATLNGVVFELSATGVAQGPGPNWMENKKAANGEHFIHGEGKILYTGVEVTKPAGSGCVAYEDNNGVEETEKQILTKQLTATSAPSATVGDGLLFTPAAGVGTPFATFFLTHCTGSFEGLNGTHTVFGSVKTATVDGATLNFTHAESTNTLLIDNEFTPAGIAGTLTLSGRAKNTTGAYTPLSATTVTT